MAVQTREKSASSKKWGYEFGVDGLMSCEEAQQWIGGASRRTLGRLMSSGKIRRGLRGNKAVLCRRSVIEYAKGLEL